MKWKPLLASVRITFVVARYLNWACRSYLVIGGGGCLCVGGSVKWVLGAGGYDEIRHLR